jgi:ParB/RepB/Spo0J family partition protein
MTTDQMSEISVKQYPVSRILISNIRATIIKNIRLYENEEEFKSLMNSLQTDGQLQSIVVVSSGDDGYELISGFRRFRAATQLGWDTIQATVLPKGTDEVVLYWANLIENSQRFKLSDYELACRARYMSEKFGISLAEYARRISYSESRVENLVRWLERLPPDILADWQAGHALLSSALLARLVSCPSDEASQYWAGWKARFYITEEEIVSSNEGRLRRGFDKRPSGAKLMSLYIAVKRCRILNEEARSVVLKVVEYCQGLARDVPGIFDPRKPNDFPVSTRIGKSRPCEACRGNGFAESGETCSVCEGKGIIKLRKMGKPRKNRDSDPPPSVLTP